MKDKPFKKRKFEHLFLSQPAQACSVTHEESRSFKHLEESEKHLDDTFPSSQKSQSKLRNGVPDDSVAVISAYGSSEVRNAKTLVGEKPIKETKVDSFHPSHNFHNDKNDGALGKSIPLKANRLHWDLNITMDEWEEPSYEEVFTSQVKNTEDITNDEMRYRKVDLAGCNEPKNLVDVQVEFGTEVHSSDPGSIHKIADLDLVKNVLQVSSGLINAEKTCAASEVQALTAVISTEGLHDSPRLNHTERKFIEQKGNTADMHVQYEKHISGRPATMLCKLSPRSNTTEWSESVSVIGKSACYADGIKVDCCEDLERKSKDAHKFTSEDLSSGCNNSNISANNSSHAVSVESMNNLQSGYDSPIEDGELREPVAHSWENIEAECYETVQQDDGLVGTDHIDVFENNYKYRNQLCDLQHDANANRQNDAPYEKSLLTKKYRANNYKQQRSSYDESPYSDPKRRKNFAFRNREREHRNNGCQIDLPLAYPESRNYSQSYRGSKYNDISKLRRVKSGPTIGGSEMSFHDNRSLTNDFSNDIYRPSTRRRAPTVRDDSYGSCRRASPVRDNDNVYHKEKCRLYPELGMRAAQEEYHDYVPEKYASRNDLRFSHKFNRSPHRNRPLRKSQSGSLFSPPYVSYEQDQRSSGRYFRQSQRQRGNRVEFRRRLKSDDELNPCSKEIER